MCHLAIVNTVVICHVANVVTCHLVIVNTVAICNLAIVNTVVICHQQAYMRQRTRNDDSDGARSCQSVTVRFRWGIQHRQHL